MAALLPALLFDPTTRTGNDALLYYNLGQSVLAGRLTKTASGTVWTPEDSCATTQVCPVSGFYAARVANPAGVALAVGGVTFPDNPPVGMSAEITVGGSPSALTLTGGGVGDTVEIFCLPNPADDVLICYDQGFSADEGEVLKAIPRKLNPADHYVTQRGEGTFNITDLMVNGLKGVKRLKGRRFTLIVKYRPNGAGLPTEIDYFTNAQFTKVPTEVPADSNESVTVAADGKFNRQLTFAAIPT